MAEVESMEAKISALQAQFEKFRNDKEKQEIELEQRLSGSNSGLWCLQGRFSSCTCFRRRGMDVDTLKAVLEINSPKMIYTVPNFQNPSGITYTNENRQEVAAALKGSKVYLVEDNSYAELLFTGSNKKS